MKSTTKILIFLTSATNYSFMTSISIEEGCDAQFSFDWMKLRIKPTMKDEPLTTVETDIITDSIDSQWSLLDTDANSHVTMEELVRNLLDGGVYKKSIGEKEANNTADNFINILDSNLDTVVSIYELRFKLHEIRIGIGNKDSETISTFSKAITTGLDEEFREWILGNFLHQPLSKSYPYYLVKLYEVFDEDINGNITWKEFRVATDLIEMAIIDVYILPIKKDLGDINKQSLFESLDFDSDKRLSVDEFQILVKDKLQKLTEKLDSEFIKIYHWIQAYLEGNSELDRASDSTLKEFQNYDFNGDGIISRGEHIAILHKHRQGYYTEARINRKFTCSDRNADRKISFNEYSFLEKLKNRSGNA